MTSEAPSARHKCLIYDGSPSEQLPIVAPLLRDGLRDNWRCLYLGSPESVQMIDSALVARGIDTATETKRGALVLTSDRSHLVGGAFDPKAMIDSLCATAEGAVRDGFAGLCATGDIRWEIGSDENFDRLLEYEAMLEQVLQERPIRGICQYRRDILPARAVHDALMSHQATYVGEALNRDNLYYIPPELLLRKAAGDQGATEGEWMCQQITRVLDAERARDRVFVALRESEAEQRRTAEALAEANRELERRVALRTAELENANRELEAFSYSVSHDLRAPLRSVDGFSRALEEDAKDRLDEAARGHLSRIRAAAGRMNALIEDLLTLSRVSRADLRDEPLDLSSIASSVAADLARQSPDRQVEVVVADGLVARGDGSLIRAVFENLLGNAFKFTMRTQKARIEVGAVDGPDGRAFFVRDNGAGFDMTYAKKLFAPFQRLHAATEFPGTGIGLATVQRIVRRHGGRVWAEAKRDEGATFSFTLQAGPPKPATTPSPTAN